MLMQNSTQSKLRLLVLLQKKYLYTCKNIVTKPNLDEFLGKFMNNIALKTVANNIEHVWQLTGFLSLNTFYCNLFCYLLTYLFISSFTLCCVLMLLICCQ